MPKLILLRHGQSQYNLENRFTGWVDVELTPLGVEEAKKAAQKIKEKSLSFDVAYTSDLRRAQNTLDIVLRELNCPETPIIRDRALNERHYGDLQGKNKAETAKEFGEEQVHIWRRSFDVPPPNGESLKDTADRTIPYYIDIIAKDLTAGKNVLIVAHGNSLRSIVMHIEQLSPEQILKTEIATGEIKTYDL